MRKAPVAMLGRATCSAEAQRGADPECSKAGGEVHAALQNASVRHNFCTQGMGQEARRPCPLRTAVHKVAGQQQLGSSHPVIQSDRWPQT